MPQSPSGGGLREETRLRRLRWDTVHRPFPIRTRRQDIQVRSGSRHRAPESALLPVGCPAVTATGSSGSGTDGFADSPLEGTGFELLVRGRVKLVVGADGSENRTARRRRCRWASVTFDQLVPRTRAGGASTSLCSTVGARTAPRTPFDRSRDRARYRYYEGSRTGPAVTACQHYFESRSFSRDVMRQSSRAVLRQKSNGVRSCSRV